jgi:hypothetical protein
MTKGGGIEGFFDVSLKVHSLEEGTGRQGIEGRIRIRRVLFYWRISVSFLSYLLLNLFNLCFSSRSKLPFLYFLLEPTVFTLQFLNAFLTVQ